MRLQSTLLFIVFFSALISPSYAAEKLSPLDIETVHLYVKPSAVAKADEAFATKHFVRLGHKGRVDRKRFYENTAPSIDPFKNRPVFKYVRGFIQINDGPKIRVDWRYRGLLSHHWEHGFPFRSMKIKLLDHYDDYNFRIININHINTDTKLYDMVSHEIYQYYGVITPRMKVVKFYVNDQYAGFKILVENIDDTFLASRGLPKGNVYRENTAADIGHKLDSGANYYQKWWKKKTLRKQKEWNDWIHLNHLYAQGRQKTAEYLLDKDYYIRWLALGLWLHTEHYGDHNLYVYHNLKAQKWYPIPWDPSVNPFTSSDKRVMLVSPNKIFTSVLINPHNYYQRNQIAWKFLHDDDFFERLNDIASEVYEPYLKHVKECMLSKLCSHKAFTYLSYRYIDALYKNASELIKTKRKKVIKYFETLPETDVKITDDELTITGSSVVGVKVRKNDWTLQEVKNLTVLKDETDETQFLVNFVDKLAQPTRTVYLELKPFTLKFRRSEKSNQFPEIATLYSDKYVSVIKQETDVQLSERKEKKVISKTTAKVNKEAKPAVKKAVSKTKRDKKVKDSKVIKNLKAKFVGLFRRVRGTEIFSKFNNRHNIRVYAERIVLKLEKKFRRVDTLPNNKIIHWSGERRLKRTTLIPKNTTLIIDPGAVIKMDKSVSLLVEGELQSLGTKDRNVAFVSSKKNPSKNNAWGSICFIHSLSQNSKMEYTKVEDGSEEKIYGTYCKGALSVYHVPFKLYNSEFKNNHADDAVNFLYSVADIQNNRFENNASDAIDLDFTNAYVYGNEFYNNGNDGLDCGTTYAEITGNKFFGQKDKGISVGEESEVTISKNIIAQSGIGIAMKDGSTAMINDNVFMNNSYGIKSYIKKKKFKKATYRLRDNYVFNNTHNLYDANEPIKVSHDDKFRVFGNKEALDAYITDNIFTIR